MDTLPSTITSTAAAIVSSISVKSALARRSHPRSLVRGATLQKFPNMEQISNERLPWCAHFEVHSEHA